MQKPGERINETAMEAVDVVRAERESALQELQEEMEELQMAAAKAKVEVRFIHYCQQRYPSLAGPKALTTLEADLEVRGRTLSERMAQMEIAERQMEAFRSFAVQFEQELSEELQTEPPASERAQAA